MFDFSSVEIVQDDSMVDSEGFPLKEAVVFSNQIVKCHPDAFDKLSFALDFFFKRPRAAVLGFPSSGKSEFFHSNEWEEVDLTDAKFTPTEIISIDLHAIGIGTKFDPEKLNSIYDKVQQIIVIRASTETINCRLKNKNSPLVFENTEQIYEELLNYLKEKQVALSIFDSDTYLMCSYQK